MCKSHKRSKAILVAKEYAEEKKRSLLNDYPQVAGIFAKKNAKKLNLNKYLHCCKRKRLRTSLCLQSFENDEKCCLSAVSSCRVVMWPRS